MFLPNSTPPYFYPSEGGDVCYECSVGFVPAHLANGARTAWRSRVVFGVDVCVGAEERYCEVSAVCSSLERLK